LQSAVEVKRLGVEFELGSNLLGERLLSDAFRFVGSFDFRFCFFSGSIAIKAWVLVPIGFGCVNLVGEKLTWRSMVDMKGRMLLFWNGDTFYWL